MQSSDSTEGSARRVLSVLPLLIVVGLLITAWILALSDRDRAEVTQLCTGSSAIADGCGSAQGQAAIAIDDQGADSTKPDAGATDPTLEESALDRQEPAGANQSPSPVVSPTASTESPTAAADVRRSPTSTPPPTSTPAGASSTPTTSAESAPTAQEAADPTTEPTPPATTTTPQPTTEPTVSGIDIGGTPERSPTPTPTGAPNPTTTSLPTSTTAPPTLTPVPTSASVPTATATAIPTAVPSATATATPTVTPTPSGPQPFGQAGGWDLVFSDDFSFLDESKWETAWFSSFDYTPPVSSNGGACFHPNQVSTEAGDLVLRIEPTSDPRCLLKDGVTQADYVAGLVNTRESFTFSYGYAEARLFLPGSGGQLENWPAFWHTGFDWPRTGEVDIAEGLSGGQPCAVYHWEGAGGQHLQTKQCASLPDPTGWHVYAAYWEPGRITYYYDGVELFTVTEGVVGDPHYLILNHTVRSNGIGTSVPSAMSVDYVRVWQAN